MFVMFALDFFRCQRRLLGGTLDHSFLTSLGENGTKYHVSRVSPTSFRAEKH